MLVVRHQFLNLGVGPEDILGISRESRPPEWSDAATEERTDVGGDENGEIERGFQSHILRHLADVVGIVERGNTPGVEIQDRESTRLDSSHTEIYTLSLHDALPISLASVRKISSGSPERAAHRNGPMPRQKSGRM